MAIYANVIIDISKEQLDRTFQYRIPAELRDRIRAGIPVIVPFGNGNRRVKGFVVEVTDKPEFDTARIKEIEGIADGDVPMEAQMIALAAWMRRNFGGTMNQALKTVLPVRRRTAEREQRLVRLLLPEDAARRELEEMRRLHRTAQARLLEALLEQSPIPREAITGKLNVTSAVLKKLEERGIIATEAVRDYRNPVKPMEKPENKITLNPVQRRIAADIAARAAAGDRRPSLIRGVTGSGKTEVYLDLISGAVRQGKQSIVLIPEIALTFQTVMRFYGYFGDRVSILNSRMSAGERYDQFERARAGELDVMIGPRSALFTPFPRLGYIIIDEEHEASYKSETVPRYHARETAIARAGLCGACVVMGSATPSVESYTRALAGEYSLYEMTERYRARPMPAVYTVDLREELRRGNRSILSARLRELMADRLRKKEQIMLFLNRRGVAGFVSCRSCGHVIKCPHCDVSLNLHNDGRLVCHYCGYTRPMVSRCPQCSSPYIGGFRAGTQKVEQYVSEQFPEAKVLRMDLDTTRRRDGHEKILSAFANREADILIGTQMIVKGHDFPYVTLVGVLAADLSLFISDYRAAERTFQLLTQAAGRAGRGERAGEVVIQTYHPEHYSIRAAARQDYRAFYEEEIRFRRLLSYPPAWNMLVLYLTSAQEDLAAEAAELLSGRIAALKDPDTQVIGPADAAVSRVNDIYKKVIYIKEEDYGKLIRIKDALEDFIRDGELFRRVSVQFDFNPMGGF